jgi:hypothetical protein
MATGVTGTGWNSTQASNSSGVVGQGWESAPISNQADFTPAGFAQTYGSTINNIAGQLNVDPSIIAGQLGLETGYGKSVIPGTNNLGNIKSTNGKGVSAIDNQTGSTDTYNAYPDADAFASNYVNLIKSKYPKAVGAQNAQQYATALKAGGYAQDPNYVGKVSKAAQVMSGVLGAITGSANANAATPSSNSSSADDDYNYNSGSANTKSVPTDDTDEYNYDSSGSIAPGKVTTTTNPVAMGARDAIYNTVSPIVGWIAVPLILSATRPAICISSGLNAPPVLAPAFAKSCPACAMALPELPSLLMTRPATLPRAAPATPPAAPAAVPASGWSGLDMRP